MKNNRHRLLTALMATVSMATAGAQEYYDITSGYIQNADFSANVDFGTDAAAGNVKANTMLTPNGWSLTSDSKSVLAVNATFQYGSKATVSGKSVPATGPDGTSDGSCLVVSAAFGNRVTFYQGAIMPAGNYKLLVTYYNCNDEAETVKENTSGWFASMTDQTMSQTVTLGTGEWRTDTIGFTLSDAASGQLQVGIRCTGALLKNAILAIDNVRLLRDTPYGPQDDLTPTPEVEGDPRFARGATMAFGRIKSVKGDNIVEQGFCWSETPEPTVNDNATTDYLSNSGKIYWMQGLKPATLYYMRAWAKNSYGKVGYGETIKFSTVPKGNITYSYNNGGDEAANKRVNAAAQEACDIFNNLSEMVKHYNIGYSAGTPTADCYYADEPWMNMGANSSYQHTGTIMHEMQHGLGLVPYSTQWNKNILRERLDGDGRGSGHWLGDRVSAFLDFWDNTTGSQLNGDYQHMWPYGINGASEDNGSRELYFANAMIGQALGEDGLEHRYSRFAEPCYIFTQDDATKYYLKCEDEARGLYTSYLVPTRTGSLRWTAMSAAEAQQNDSAAWYITFTPSNQYYQLRNAATGQYLTYSSGFKTATRTSTTSADNFHFMRGRVDVTAGPEGAKRGYWLVHPTDNWTPSCLQANANGMTGSATFDIKNSATTQRWLILTAEQTTQMEQTAIAAIKNEVKDLLANIRQLALVPHQELKPGTDDAYTAALSDIAQRAESVNTLDGVTVLQDEADQAAFEFLCNVSATDKTQPFDLTYRVKSPGMDSTDGWTGTAPTLNHSCAEFFEKVFNFYQNIDNLPGGDYQVLVQGFQRPGASATAYNDYAAGNDKVTASLYALNVNNAAKLAHIAADAQKTKLGKGTETAVGSTFYIPNNMLAAAAYFDKGLYENSVDATVENDGATMRIGIRATSQPDSYWTIFDNFRLHFFGKPVTAIKGDVNGDGTVDVADISAIIDVMANATIPGASATGPADVNGDGSVDVADISAVIDIMAGK